MHLHSGTLMCYLIRIFVEKLRITCVLVDRSRVDETGVSNNVPP